MFADFSKMPAGEISKVIANLPEDDYLALIEILNRDSRKSVRALAEGLQKKMAAIEIEKSRILKMLQMESELRFRGYTCICGIDEVGRGSLAGPVVAAAVIMPKNSAIRYVNDSKKLSSVKRETLDLAIKEEAIAWSVGVMNHETIDAVNILEATRMAMVEAVNQLKVQPNLLLIDALRIPSVIPVKSVIHGDATCYSIAAASIIAKEYRDRLMQEYHRLYPQYGFDSNMGYGTQKHIDALKSFGPTPIHRKSFIGKFKNEKG